MPDTTGPSITNIGANPDGNNPNWVYDNYASYCATTVTTISATITDPSSLSSVALYVRYYDGTNPPTSYTNAGPTFNSGTQKYEKAIDFPGTADTISGGRIDYFWEAFDNSPQHNVTASGVNSVPISACAGVIP